MIKTLKIPQNLLVYAKLYQSKNNLRIRIKMKMIKFACKIKKNVNYTETYLKK